MQVKNPLKDGLVFLRGERTFIMRLKDGEPKMRENEEGIQSHHQGKQLKGTLEGGTC